MGAMECPKERTCKAILRQPSFMAASLEPSTTNTGTGLQNALNYGLKPYNPQKEKEI